MIFAFLIGAVTAETFDTAGKISEAGITFNAKESFSLSGLILRKKGAKKGGKK